MRLFDEGDYLGAIDAFDRAYRLKPHFSVMCNVALCHERRGDYVQAGRFYQHCLEQGGKDGPKAMQIRRSLEQARARVALLEVSSPGDGGTVFLDGRKTGAAPQRLWVNPGPHVVEVRRDGAKPEAKMVEIRGGEHIVITLVLQPDTQRHAASSPVEKAAAGSGRPGVTPWWFWTSAGLAVALAVAATTVGIRTLRVQEDYIKDPTQERLEAGRAHRLATNVLWGLSAAAGATATTLFFVTDFASRGEAGKSGRRGAQFILGAMGRF